MQSERLPVAEILGKLALTESCVNLAVANSMHRKLGFPAMTFGQQVMLINAWPPHQRSVAQWAVRQR